SADVERRSRGVTYGRQILYAGMSIGHSETPADASPSRQRIDLHRSIRSSVTVCWVSSVPECSVSCFSRQPKRFFMFSDHTCGLILCLPIAPRRPSSSHHASACTSPRLIASANSFLLGSLRH